MPDYRDLLDDAPDGAGMDTDGLYVPIVLSTESESLSVVGALLAGFIGGPLVGLGLNTLLGRTDGWVVLAISVVGVAAGIVGAGRLARRGKTVLRVDERFIQIRELRIATKHAGALSVIEEGRGSNRRYFLTVTAKNGEKRWPVDPLHANLDKAAWFVRTAQSLRARDVGRRTDVPEDLSRLRGSQTE